MLQAVLFYSFLFVFQYVMIQISAVSLSAYRTIIGMNFIFVYYVKFVKKFASIYTSIKPTKLKFFSYNSS